MKKIIPLLLLFPIFTGCSSINNYPALIDYDSYTLTTMQEINEKQIIDYLDNECSFTLFLYSSSCSLCDAAKSNINDYISEKHLLIYKYTYNPYQYNQLIEKYSGIFNEDLNFSSLLFFKSGNLTDTFHHDITGKKSVLTRKLNHKLKTGYGYFSSEANSLDNFIENNKKSLLFFFNSNDDNECKFYNSTLKKAINNKNKISTLFLDFNFVNIEDFSDFIDGFELATIEHQIIYIENKKIENLIDYLNDQSILDFINLYYQ